MNHILVSKAFLSVRWKVSHCINWSVEFTRIAITERMKKNSLFNPIHFLREHFEEFAFDDVSASLKSVIEALFGVL